MKKADIILRGNAIFDAISEQPAGGFVAVAGNRILAVSKNGGDEYIGEKTKVYDLKDRLIMPGFHDSHVHLTMSGMYRVCANLIDAKSEEEACKMLRDFTGKNPSNDPWIIGFSWHHVFWDNKTLPTKASLDKYFPDRPVLLLNADCHGAWVNSRGLEIAGITKDTPDPYGGYFQRNEMGEPTGFLCESAIGPVGKFAFNFTPEQEMRYVKTFMKEVARLGITSVNDLMPFFHGNMGNVETYSMLDRRGELTVRINAALNLLGDLDEACRLRDKCASEKVTAGLLKQFLDGVGPTHTALMLEDYSDAPGNRGISLSNLEAIRKAVSEAHKRGLSVKLHSCGDASARLALDYYEEAIRLHGKNECRHAIEHLEVISPQDIPRFRELGVIPSMQPEHIAITQVFSENPYPEKFGPERIKMSWPCKTLLDVAGVIAIGSDCPVVDNNPFLEIFRAVSRVHNDGEPKGGWNPSEKLTIAEVLRGYTYGAAYGVRRENDLGTLEAGKLADIAVIDRNLFAVGDVWDIMKARVCMTVMDGKVIHEEL